MFDGQLYEEPQVVRDLREARKYIERGWVRHTRGADANGVFTDPLSSDAVSWCLGGALMAATNATTWSTTRTMPAMDLLDRVAIEKYPQVRRGFGRGFVFVDFNNAIARDVNDVTSLIDDAIKVALSEKEAAHV